MLNMLTILGNEFSDTIHIVSEFPKEDTNIPIIKTLEHWGGGVFNFDRGIPCYHSKPNIKVDIKRHYAESTIIINKSTGSRTCLSNYNYDFTYDKEELLDIKESEWLHIMYLDILPCITLKEMKKLREKAKTISVDLCLSKHTEEEKERLYSLLPLVDYLITSHKEVKDLDFNTSAKTTFPNLHSIIRYPEVTLWNTQTIVNPYIKKHINNSLGAGDYFASQFVQYMIKSREENNGIVNEVTNCIVRAIQYAHEKTSEYVMIPLEDWYD
jgi:sugar/nucleoside kinase (ribokinase family)